MANLTLQDIIEWGDIVHPDGPEVLEKVRQLDNYELARGLLFLVSQLHSMPFIAIDDTFNMLLMTISLVVTERIDPKTAEAAQKIEDEINEIFKDQ